ncbi:MAG: aspartate aminotransferase family protein [Desulfobacteraceae bacterium]|jgi:glutamate/tyrosine decarboxylase-like PLP-dependent enzyme
MEIPQKGVARDELFQELEALRAHDVDWRSGKVFGYVFDPGPEVLEVGKEAYAMFLTENALDFTVFPSLLQLENELVAMAGKHVGADDQVVGNFTSGGTESIILAVKAARDYFRAGKPDIEEPEMILPATAHAAFHKAAHYLGLKAVVVPTDAETFRADVETVRQAISPNTILLVGSAPSYAHGVVDPITDLGQLALENNLLLHVDACMGGFMLPYFRRLGAPVPDFDFSVPGVTSLSMDLHKYAYTPKGASIILYRDRRLRRHQIFACSQWAGYTMVNNAVQSSKSGGPMAAAWAVLKFVGDEGYMELARRKLEATHKIVEGIQRMKDLRLLGKPDMCLVAFTSDTVNIFHIIDEMNERGWYIQPALAFGNSKEHIHMSINASNVGWVNDFLSDLEVCVEKAKHMSSGHLSAALEESLSSMDLSEIPEETFSQMLSMAGIQGTRLPKRMADINGVLNGLPPDFRERLLIEFVNDLFVM